MFKKDVIYEIDEFDKREGVIQFLRKADAEDYKKIIKIVDVLRQADIDVAVIEAGSKKAYEADKKESSELDDLDWLME